MTLALAQPEIPITTKSALSVCILDDDPAMVEMLQATVEQFGFGACGTSDPQQALEEVGSGRCRVVLTDVQMPAMNGFDFLQLALERDPGAIVILMTGYYSIESAIEAIRCGSYDYLPKPIDRARLRKSLEEISEQIERQRRIGGLDAQLLNDLEVHGIVGRSPSMVELMDLARKIARHYSNVLLTGPTGAGKELVAHALHQMSPVAAQRFAVPSSRRSSKASCSATSAEPSPEPARRARGFLSTPVAAPSFWTKWEKCLSPCRPSSCASFRTGKSSASARPRFTWWTSA